MIPYGRQNIGQSDIDAVLDALTSNFLTQGPRVPAFETAVAEWCDAPYGVAVNSATSALHVACMALGLGPGDLMWTVPNTFVASANAGVYCGAEVDFVDIDPDTYCMSPSALAAKLATAKAVDRLPKIIIPVHFAGQSADMKSIGALARTYGSRLIEDASHAIGARYLEGPVGNCAYSDICVFSFHPVKIITTAEGGLATTQDAELAERMRLHRSHGVTRDTTLMDGLHEEAWYYEMVDLGYNYRMTELQAALGLAQMTRLASFVARRNTLAARYDELLAPLPLKCPTQSTDCHSSYHLYPIQVENRTDVFNTMRLAGIGVNVHYIPIHTQPYWRARGFHPGDFPNAENYYARAISIPLHSGLSEADQDSVIVALTEALNV